MSNGMSSCRLAKTAAVLWLAVVIVAFALTFSWFETHRPQTDLMALLPKTEQNDELVLANQKLASQSQTMLTILIEVPNSDDTILSSLNTTLDQWIQAYPLLLSPVSLNDSRQVSKDLKSLAQYQITWSDEAFLESTDSQALLTRLLNQLTSPLTSIDSFQNDPFGLASEWLLERSNDFPVTQLNGHLWLKKDQQRFLVLPLQTDLSQIYNGSGQLHDAISTLRTNLSEQGLTRVWVTGIPMFADYAAHTAQKELSLLGSLSLIGVCLLAWLWYRRLSILLLILAVVFQAFIVATASTLLVFGQIHLITLVFGTTLIGITVDYSAHYFGHRLSAHNSETRFTLHKLFPSLSLALLSTVVAFLIMLNTPMQGLRQMSIFCCSGIISAFIAVLLWLPLFKQKASNHSLSKIGHFIQQTPAWDHISLRFRVISILAIVALLVTGSLTFQSSDRLQELNNAPKELLQQSQEVAVLLNTPSVNQYFIVKGQSLNDLLRKQESLYQRLQKEPLPGVTLSSLSDWVSSDERLARRQTLLEQAVKKINPSVQELLGKPLVVHNLDIPSSDERLRALKQHSDLMGQLNLLTDNTALVQIRGLHSLNIDQVRQLCTGLTGVSWVDIPANLSEILSQYRNRIVQLLTLSIGAVIIILVLRFKQQSWRAFLPTVLGLSLTVAVLSLFGYSFSLFMALALILLLGLGFDYGIFMSCSQQEKENLAAIAFAALTTFLSFGILTLSNTPALKIFGLTVAIGQCFIVTLTILFRKKDAS